MLVYSSARSECFILCQYLSLNLKLKIKCSIRTTFDRKLSLNIIMTTIFPNVPVISSLSIAHKPLGFILLTNHNKLCANLLTYDHHQILSDIILHYINTELYTSQYHFTIYSRILLTTTITSIQFSLVPTSTKYFCGLLFQKSCPNLMMSLLLFIHYLPHMITPHHTPVLIEKQLGVFKKLNCEGKKEFTALNSFFYLNQPFLCCLLAYVR